MVATDDAGRLWYAVATLLALAYYSNDPGDTGKVLRCPCWAPAWMVRWAFRTSSASRIVLAIVGAALAVSPSLAMESMAARSLFLGAVACADLWSYASYGGHPGFMLLYTSAAMVIPVGPSRSGVLRLLVAHQLGSSGIVKLWVGGRDWFDFETIAEWLRFSRDSLPFKSHFLIEIDWLKQRWLINFLLKRPALCSACNAAGLAVELVAVPLALGGGRLSLQLLFVLGSGFHLSVLLLTGIFFAFNIPCYALALLAASDQDPSCLLNSASLIVALWLGGTTLLWLEDWPLNAVALFPFNHKQMRRMTSFLDRFVLVHRGDGEGEQYPSPGKKVGSNQLHDQREEGFGQEFPCLIRTCVSSCPTVLFPRLIDAIGGPGFTKEEEERPIERIHEVLRDWVKCTGCFVQPGTFRPFDDVVLVEPKAEHGKTLKWDLLDPLLGS